MGIFHSQKCISDWIIYFLLFIFTEYLYPLFEFLQGCFCIQFSVYYKFCIFFFSFIAIFSTSSTALSKLILSTICIFCFTSGPLLIILSHSFEHNAWCSSICSILELLTLVASFFLLIAITFDGATNCIKFSFKSIYQSGVNLFVKYCTSSL